MKLKTYIVALEDVEELENKESLFRCDLTSRKIALYKA